MPNSSHICPQCQAPIPADAPGGLCPACVLLGAAAPTELLTGALSGAPNLEEVAAAFPELEVLELIGHGGMGVVFKARQPKLDRLIALKILPPSLARQPGFIERFTREARALAKLSHPHIVAVFDFGERAGFCYLAMEFVNGVNLRAAMRAGVKPEQALSLVPRICEALQFAHDRGVLHRDIKPENILLDTAGVPKLADFGIAKLAGDPTAAGLTLSGAQLGTAAYMAPEQVEKPATVDHRADIYSLGVVLYEMLTGELPLGRFAAPSEKSRVAPSVDEVVFRALEKERERRQQSAKEMQTQVEHVSAAGVTSAPAPAPRPAAPLPYRELPWSRTAVWAIILVLLSGPIGAGMFATTYVVVEPVLGSRDMIEGQLNGPVAGNIIIFGFIFALAGTVLGWKAVSDVRYHRGHLRGGGCAVFGALFMPVFALLITVIANFEDIRDAISDGKDHSGVATFSASMVVVAAVAASIWAVRALWRFVHDGPTGIPLPVRPARNSTTAAAPAVDDEEGDGPWSRVFFALASLSGVGIPISAMLSWKAVTPVHMVATMIVFFTLHGIAKGFERHRPGGQPHARMSAGTAGIIAVVFVVLAVVLPLVAVQWMQGTAADKRARADAELIRVQEAVTDAGLRMTEAALPPKPGASDAEKLIAENRHSDAKRAYAEADKRLQAARDDQRRSYAANPNGDRLGLAPWIGANCTLAALVFGIMAYRRRAVPATVAGVPGMPLANPWPRRIFWLIIGFIVIPAVMVFIGLCVPYLSLQKSPPPGHATASVSFESDPIRPQAQVLVINAHAPFGTVVDYSFRIRDAEGERELPAHSAIAAWERSAAPAGITLYHVNTRWEFTVGDGKNAEFGIRRDIKLLDPIVGGPKGSLSGAGSVHLDSSRMLRWESHPDRVAYHGQSLPAKIPFIIGKPEGNAAPDAVGVEVFLVVSARAMKGGERAPAFSVHSGGDRFERLANPSLSGVVQGSSAGAVSLQDEAIRLARERLNVVRQRVEAGVASPNERITAEMDLAIAEARGDALLIANAKVRLCEERLDILRQQHKVGIATPSALNEAEAELNTARQEQEKARRSTPIEK